MGRSCSRRWPSSCVLSFGINRLSTGAAQALFWAFAALMGAVAVVDLPHLHRRLDRADLLRHGGRLREPQPVGLHDEEGSFGLGHLPAHGRGRPDRRLDRQHLLDERHVQPRDRGDRRADLRGPHRLRHAEDQEHLLPGRRHRFPRQGGDHGRAGRSISTSSTCSCSCSASWAAGNRGKATFESRKARRKRRAFFVGRVSQPWPFRWRWKKASVAAQACSAASRL